MCFYCGVRRGNFAQNVKSCYVGNVLVAVDSRTNIFGTE